MTSSAPEFLIDEILPSGQAHLIGGASGSGKTTWIFQNLLAPWQQSKPVFDHISHPVPYVYISLDRTRSSVERTLRRLGVFDQITRVICLDEVPDDCVTLEDVIKLGIRAYPDSHLIVIEGFGLLSGDKTNGYTAVGKLMQRAAKLCAKRGLTVIGVCHAPKMKTDEQFQHSRELLLGSVSWAAYSDTIIILNLSETTNCITIKVMPRNAAMETHEMSFGSNGQLEAVIKGTKRDYLVVRISRLSFGRPITRAEILQWAAACNISPRTADEAIKINVDNGILTPFDEGFYERTTLKSPPVAPESDITVE